MVLSISVGDAMYFSHPLCSGASRPETRVCTFQLEAHDASHGIREGLLALLAPLKSPGTRSMFTSHGWPEKMTSFVSEKPGERRAPTSDSSVTHSVSNVWYLRTGQFNAGGSSIFIHKNLLPDHAIVSHEITCQGRDHIVTIRSGEGVLVIVSVHFEPDLVLWDLRGRLHRISLLWPRYPEALGVIIGEFNIREHEEGRFNVRNQTLQKVRLGKRFLFVSFSRMLSKSRNQILQGGYRRWGYASHTIQN